MELKRKKPYWVATIIGIVVGLVGWQVGSELYRRHQLSSALNRQFDQLRSTAIEKHPDKPVVEGMADAASEQTSAQLKSDADQSKRLQRASSVFLGFYLINTRTRQEFCREQGVDISSFVSPFETEHANEYATARDAIAHTSITEDQLYSMIQAQLRATIVLDMRDIESKINSESPKAACEYLAAHGPDLAAAMHISKLQPDVYRVLSEKP